ncbi:hypothetical protein BGZ81_009921 [Podila clonocystis]|nr:hypothetical protein BGZ81_009921 [Podila clonocystis]
MFKLEVMDSWDEVSGFSQTTFKNFGSLPQMAFPGWSKKTFLRTKICLKVAYTYSRDRLKRLLDVMVEMAEDDKFPGDYDYCLTVLSSRVGFIHPNTEDNMPPKMKSEEEVNNWPHMILVYAQWANLDGASQVYNPKFFNKIRDAAGERYLSDWNVLVDDSKPTPMSKLSSEWTFNNVREFDAPYVKRTYMSNSATLGSDGWTDWVSDRIQLIHDHWDWQKGNDKGVGRPAAGQPEPKFCMEDRRVLWGSHDLDLLANKQYYYEDGKYNRLCGIKHKYDPEQVFSPNTFCVRPTNPQDDGSVHAPVHGPDLALPRFPSFAENHLTADKDKKTYDNVMAPELEKRRDDRHKLLRPKL